MPRTYEIHLLGEDDPVVVAKCEQELSGVRFTDAEGDQVFLPWHRVDAIRSYRAVDEPEPVEVEPAAGAEDEPGEPGPVPPPPAEPVAKASEWADADPDVVRAWAREQGKDVKDSGPIPKAVLSAYAAAHSS